MPEHTWRLSAGGALRGEVLVPGDKSIGHRCLMLGAIARGRSVLTGMPTGQDVLSTEHVLRRLGVSIGRKGHEVVVEGHGPEALVASAQPLDCGNSGTTMRLMAGLLSGAGVCAVLTGDGSLRRRPMGRVAEPLRAMGVLVETADDGRPPIRLEGGRVRAVTYRSPVASAQVKSCVLLAGLGAEGRTCVVEPTPTRDHTERLLREMGVRVGEEPEICIDGPVRLGALHGRVPADASSAAYWIVAATLAPGSDLRLPGVGVNPGRRALLDLLLRWGADIELVPGDDELGEPVADLRVRAPAAPLRGGRIEPVEVPALIDELPLLGLLAPWTRDGVEVSGAGELRFKESDRVASTCAAVRALGGDVDEYPDGFAVAGGTGLRSGEVDAAGDHRIALGAAAVSVVATGTVAVRGAEAAAVSYPGFLDALARVRR